MLPEADAEPGKSRRKRSLGDTAVNRLRARTAVTVEKAGRVASRIAQLDADVPLIREDLRCSAEMCDKEVRAQEFAAAKRRVDCYIALKLVQGNYPNAADLKLQESFPIECTQLAEAEREGCAPFLRREVLELCVIANQRQLRSSCQHHSRNDEATFSTLMERLTLFIIWSQLHSSSFRKLEAGPPSKMTLPGQARSAYVRYPLPLDGLNLTVDQKERARAALGYFKSKMAELGQEYEECLEEMSSIAEVETIKLSAGFSESLVILWAPKAAA